MLGGRTKGQSAIDYISTYGFALLIISIAIYAAFEIGIFNYANSPSYCYTTSPFSCGAYAINTVGVMAVAISQTSGGIVNITGAACSAVPNTTRVGPKYGNANVLGYNSVPQFYPNNALQHGLVLNPGIVQVLYVNCYNGNLGIATGAIGAGFNGYLWLNYTYSNLPAGYHNIERVASISTKYIAAGTAH